MRLPSYGWPGTIPPPDSAPEALHGAGRIAYIPWDSGGLYYRHSSQGHAGLMTDVIDHGNRPDLAIEKDVVVDDEPDLHVVQFFLLDLDAASSGDQVPNDCNQDGKLNLTDAICLLGHLFQGHPSELPCAGGTAGDRGNVALLDCDGNERVDLTDAICVLDWLFRGGPEPHRARQCGKIAGCPSACRA